MTIVNQEQLELCESGSSGPAHTTQDNEGIRQVLQELAMLPDNQQEVVRLRFSGGLSYKEIAEETGLKASNVGYLIFTAVKAIRKRLKLTAAQPPNLKMQTEDGTRVSAATPNTDASGSNWRVS